MSSVEYLREFVNGRLTAAAEEIFGVFKRTIVEYEEELERQRRLLDIVWKPQIKLHGTELPQQHVCKEEEVPADQQLCTQERSSSLDQEEPEPPQIKEELEEQAEQLVLKQEADDFMLIPPYEGSDHSEDQSLDFIPDDNLSVAETESVVNIPVITYVIPEANSDLQLLYHSSHVTESKDQKEGEHGDSGSTRNTELQPKKRCHKSDSNSVYDLTVSDVHSNADTGEKSLKCDTCGKAFKYKSELYRHLRIHTGEKPYSCEICGKHFRYNSHLTVHMTTHTGENPYYCKICGKDFPHNSRLVVHMRIHTGEEPFTCKTCGRAFRLNRHLKVHMRTHTGEKPYLCKICGKTFCEISSLTRHTRIHTGEKPYVCNTCGKRFSDLSVLKRHSRIHTGEKPFVCATCGKAFGLKGNLTAHMRLHTHEKSQDLQENTL
ncbi:zinc finger protein 664-like isoform X1 [Plectropomus leopardus]|uniref:zinc finger protein 664-like isoform X1 n=1 Tax=Plectropomus leopardus TaxID=160734 RepID=UPI001C4BA274|nr:zinc finger protein 664-like isoform X1 [Plectropomus leopardus]